MTAENEQVTSTDASAHAATQLRRGAGSTSRVGPGTRLAGSARGGARQPSSSPGKMPGGTTSVPGRAAARRPLAFSQ
jgi:hypothetical protein